MIKIILIKFNNYIKYISHIFSIGFDYKEIIIYKLLNLMYFYK